MVAIRLMIAVPLRSPSVYGRYPSDRRRPSDGRRPSTVAVHLTVAVYGRHLSDGHRLRSPSIYSRRPSDGRRPSDTRRILKCSSDFSNII